MNVNDNEKTEFLRRFRPPEPYLVSHYLCLPLGESHLENCCNIVFPYLKIFPLTKFFTTIRCRVISEFARKYLKNSVFYSLSFFSFSALFSNILPRIVLHI